MRNILLNTLAVIAGALIGAFVNMGLIKLGVSLIAPPPGVDVNNAESLAKGIHLFSAKHFVFPFLAHAVGTFAGALVAYLIGASRRAQLAYAIGVLFLIGGIAASFMIPAPAWFIALDLLVAYLPMAWLAIRAGRLVKPGKG